MADKADVVVKADVVEKADVVDKAVVVEKVVVVDKAVLVEKVVAVDKAVLAVVEEVEQMVVVNVVLEPAYDIYSSYSNLLIKVK